MRSLEEKRALRRFIYSRLTIIVLLLVLLLLGRSVWKAWQRYEQAKSDRDASARNYEELEEREAKLAERLLLAESERGEEEQLREKYGAARPGEQVIIIVDNDTATSTPARSRSGFWTWLWSWF